MLEKELKDGYAYESYAQKFGKQKNPKFRSTNITVLKSTARKGIEKDFKIFGFKGLLQGYYLQVKLQSTVFKSSNFKPF